MPYHYFTASPPTSAIAILTERSGWTPNMIASATSAFEITNDKQTAIDKWASSYPAAKSKPSLSDLRIKDNNLNLGIERRRNRLMASVRGHYNYKAARQEICSAPKSAALTALHACLAAEADMKAAEVAVKVLHTLAALFSASLVACHAASAAHLAALNAAAFAPNTSTGLIPRLFQLLTSALNITSTCSLNKVTGEKLAP